MGEDAPRPSLACEGDDEEDQLRREVVDYLCQVHDHDLLRALRVIVSMHVLRFGARHAGDLTEAVWSVVTAGWWMSLFT